jgi:hypothetical protein
VGSEIVLSPETKAGWIANLPSVHVRKDQILELVERAVSEEKRSSDACQQAQADLWSQAVREKDARIAELERGHCKDCCCARSWEALGITTYTGMDIPDHIRALAEESREKTSQIALRDEALRQQDTRIAELEQIGREYVAQTDPLLACGSNDDPASGHCGTCRACVIEERDALNGLLERVDALLPPDEPVQQEDAMSLVMYVTPSPRTGGWRRR